LLSTVSGEDAANESDERGLLRIRNDRRRLYERSSYGAGGPGLPSKVEHENPDFVGTFTAPALDILPIAIIRQVYSVYFAKKVAKLRRKRILPEIIKRI
jgi:hypothetical protein